MQAKRDKLARTKPALRNLGGFLRLSPGVTASSLLAVANAVLVPGHPIRLEAASSCLPRGVYE